MTNYDVIVVGSGVIGLSIAWQVGLTGRRVVVVDPHPGRGSSYAAAGMLAPVNEAAWGDEPLIELNVRSAAGWPSFARALETASDLPVGLRETGALLVAGDGSDHAQLEELFKFQQHLGLDSSWCTASTCRTLEPLLAPGVRGGILAPSDHQVDNRRVLAALGVAARRSGVQFLHASVLACLTSDGRISGVVMNDGELYGDLTIIAAGYASGAIAGLPDPPLAVRPVKGQILRLRTRDGRALLERTVRGLIGGQHVYIVPRADGGVVVGATSEEVGEDTSVTAIACYELLRNAIHLLPAVGEIELVETLAALRPGSPDNAPLVGAASVAGLAYATGHYRNGVLLAPVTAEAIVALVEQGEIPDWASPFAPGRFANASTATSDPL